MFIFKTKDKKSKDQVSFGMGIKDLTKFLEEYRSEVSLDELRHLRVAVDISIYLYKYVKGSTSWKDRLIDLVLALRSRCIKSVFVFDGPNVPHEKRTLVSGKRRDEEKNLREKLQKLIQIFKDHEGRVQKKDFVSVRATLVKMFPRSNVPIGPFLNGFIKNKIESLSVQTQEITPEVTLAAKKILDVLGIAHFQADGEAESLCVDLCMSKKVDAILTEDTDVLAYTGGEEKGDLIMLSKLEFLPEAKVNLLSKRLLLEELEMDENMFRDMCILSGCDYNLRVYGYSPTKSYKKIMEHRNIEEVFEKEKFTEEDIDKTNYQRCRELFACKDIDDLGVSVGKDIDEDELEVFLKENKSRYSVKEIRKCWIVDDTVRMLLGLDPNEESENENEGEVNNMNAGSSEE
jgi:flap endonuclease-1